MVTWSYNSNFEHLSLAQRANIFDPDSIKRLEREGLLQRRNVVKVGFQKLSRSRDIPPGVYFEMALSFCSKKP